MLNWVRYAVVQPLKIFYVLQYIDLWGSCIDVIIGHIRLLCSVIHATNKDACMQERGGVGAQNHHSRILSIDFRISSGASSNFLYQVFEP